MSRLVFFVAVSHITVSYVLDEIRRRIVTFKVVKRVEPDIHMGVAWPGFGCLWVPSWGKGKV